MSRVNPLVSQLLMGMEAPEGFTLPSPRSMVGGAAGLLLIPPCAAPSVSPSLHLHGAVLSSKAGLPRYIDKAVISLSPSRSPCCHCQWLLFPSRPCFFSWHSLSPLPFVCSVSSHGQHQPVRTLHLISACSEDYVKCYPLACTVLLSLHHSSVQWALVYSQFTGEEATYCRIRKLECSGGFQASELSSCTCGVCTSIAGNIWQ